MPSEQLTAPSPLRKLRHYLAWPFAAGLAVFAHSTDLGFRIGVPVILAGELVRIWAQGYLLKSRQLTTDGPYAFVRHPLYVGNFLIGAGFCMIIWHPLVAIFFVASFFSVYWLTVRLEEQKLHERFEPAFASYVQHVRRFWPRWAPYPHRSRDPFVWSRVWGHGEHITILAIVCLLLGVSLRQELYQERQPVSAVWGPIAWIAVIGFILAFFQFQRRRDVATKS